MGYIVGVKVPPNIRLLVELNTLEFFFDEEKEVAVIKKKPLIYVQEGCGFRHWYRIIGPRVQGGFKLNRVSENKYERILPFARIIAEKDATGKWSVRGEGYHIFVAKDESTLRPARSNEEPARVDDAWVMLRYDNSLKSRTCGGGISIKMKKGEVKVTYGDTACAIDKVSTAVVLAKNGSVFEVCYGKGDYRGDCWDECETHAINIRVKDGKLVLNWGSDEYVASILELNEEDIA